MFFLAFPCVTPEGFNFLDAWCLVYSDRFLTQLSVELFGIFFENLVLPVDIIPLYKPAYYLCFCLDFLLQFFPHNWCIICKVGVIALFNFDFFCISVRAEMSLSFLSISFSIFFFPERFFPDLFRLCFLKYLICLFSDD